MITEGDLTLRGSATVQGSPERQWGGCRRAHEREDWHIVGKNDISGQRDVHGRLRANVGAPTRWATPAASRRAMPGIPLPPVSALAFYKKAPWAEDPGRHEHVVGSLR